MLPKLHLQEPSAYMKRLKSCGMLVSSKEDHQEMLLCVGHMTGGWLNSPLRFPDEPCWHKILDLIGDFSLLAQYGNRGLPVAHILAYKVSCTESCKCTGLIYWGCGHLFSWFRMWIISNSGEIRF